MPFTTYTPVVKYHLLHNQLIIRLLIPEKVAFYGDIIPGDL